MSSDTRNRHWNFAWKQGTIGFTVPLPGILLLLSAALCSLPSQVQSQNLQISWAERIQVAWGAAYRGPWRMNESEWNFVDDATVAINDVGDVAVAWADHARQDIYFQVYGPEGEVRFAEPVNISRSPSIFSWLPRMIMTSDDPAHVFVLWQEIVFSGGTHGGEIFFARSTDGGESFHQPINLSTTMAGAGKGRLSEEIWFNGSLDLTRGSNGHLYAAWTEYEGALRFSQSTDAGETFSEPLLIAGGGGTLPVRAPSLAVDSRNRIHLVWTVGEVKDADIHYAISIDGGQSFEEGRAILPSNGYSDAPKIAVDSWDRVHLVYGESPEGPLQPHHVRYARSLENAPGFGESKRISTIPREDIRGGGFPYLDVDGQGNLYVLWELFTDRGIRPQGLGFTSSADRGDSFPSPSVVPGSLDPAMGFNGSQQGLYMEKLAVNGRGDIAVVNCTFDPNEQSVIWLVRGRAENIERGE